VQELDKKLSASPDRLLYVDVARVAAAVAVVVVHAAAPLTFAFGGIPVWQWWIANLFSSFARWCVPVFIMISGALMLDSQREDKPQLFLSKRLWRLLIPLVFWSVAYALYYHWVRGDELSLGFSLQRMIFDQPYEHLYFLFILVELTLITPWLKRFWWQLSGRQQNIFLASMLLMTFLWRPNRFVGTLFIPYVSYYLLGIWISTVSVSHRAGRWLLAIAGSALSLIALGTYLLVSHRIPNNDGLYLYTYTQPLALIASVGVMLGFKSFFAHPRSLSMRWLRWVRFMAPLTFGIYLIHPIALDWWQWALSSISQSLIFKILEVLILTVLSFITSVGIIWAVKSRLKSPIV